MRLGIVTLVLGACGGTGAAPLPGTLAITNVSVVDVERGVVVPGRQVLIDGPRIVAVEANGASPIGDGVARLDGTDRFLIPGLWDMHAHIIERASTVAGPLFIANGVTGVREMWSDGDDYRPMFVAFRDSVRRGLLVGPRLLLTSTPIDGPPGSEPGVTIVRSVPDARDAVDSAVAHGMDLVQAFPSLSREAYRAAARRAAERGIVFGGLVPMAASFDDALEAGHRARDFVGEWPIWCSTAGDAIRARLAAAADSDARAPAKASRLLAARAAAKTRLLETFSPAHCDSLGRRLASDSVWEVPRMVIERDHGYARPADPTRDSVRAQYAGPEATAFWDPIRRSQRRDEQDRAKVNDARRTWDRTLEIMGILHRAGVHFLAGTETGDLDIHPGFSLHDELEVFVLLGMSPAEALRSATLEPARYLRGTDSLGAVAVGHLADLVLLDRNPLADIAATRAIHAVVANGRLIDSAGLASLLESAARAARAR